MSSEEIKINKRSGAWYLLPIFLTIIGGVIAYFVIKEDDPKKAKNCLYLGIILTAIGIGFTVVSGAMFAYQMENSPFFDEGFESSDNFATSSEMTFSDKSQINSLAEAVEYDYNSHGLKINYIQLQDEEGNNVTVVDDKLYRIVSEVQNRDDVEKELSYDIFSEDKYGTGGSMGGPASIEPSGTTLIEGGWQIWSPGIHEIEVEVQDINSEIPKDSENFWRLLYLKEK